MSRGVRQRKGDTSEKTEHQAGSQSIQNGGQPNAQEYPTSSSIFRKMATLVFFALAGALGREILVGKQSFSEIQNELMSGFMNYYNFVKTGAWVQSWDTIPSKRSKLKDQSDSLEVRMKSSYSKYMKPQVSFPKPPDNRPLKCRDKKYPMSNSTVTIVIPYLKEKWSHIKGTVGSLLANTPQHLLSEIIFISDGNSDDEAHEAKILTMDPYRKNPNLNTDISITRGLSQDSDQLDEQILDPLESHDPSITRELIRVIRLPERNGLIYAKELGAREARGDVVMFFEAHCIVNKHWLEPLLHILEKRPDSLVLPTLDYISQTDFKSYHTASEGRYRFEWNFNLVYTNPPAGANYQTDVPYFAPATSGGIFVIRKDRFLQLNLFDVGMKQWGGDQIELSFKAWRCGGSIIISPCSRVGHLFRDPEFRPYNVDVPQVVENYSKLARVWLEQPYLRAFYKVKPEAITMARNENLSVPKRNFKALKCKSMDWYVKNVDLELGWESTRICIPGAAKEHPSACPGGAPAASGRSTIHITMGKDEYIDQSEISEMGYFGTNAYDTWFRDLVEEE